MSRTTALGIAHLQAALLGWGLLTWALTRFIGPVGWAIGGGLLLLALPGWRALGAYARDGLLSLFDEKE